LVSSSLVSSRCWSQGGCSKRSGSEDQGGAEDPTRQHGRASSVYADVDPVCRADGGQPGRQGAGLGAALPDHAGAHQQHAEFPGLLYGQQRLQERVKGVDEEDRYIVRCDTVMFWC